MIHWENIIGTNLILSGKTNVVLIGYADLEISLSTPEPLLGRLSALLVIARGGTLPRGFSMLCLTPPELYLHGLWHFATTYAPCAFINC